jgi:hypothetical protein
MLRQASEFFFFFLSLRRTFDKLLLKFKGLRMQVGSKQLKYWHPKPRVAGSIPACRTNWHHAILFFRTWRCRTTLS